MSRLSSSPPAGLLAALRPKLINTPFLSRSHPLPRQIASHFIFQRYLIEVLEVQEFEPRLRSHQAALAVIGRIRAALQRQSESMVTALKSLRGDPADLRAAGSGLADVFVGFFLKARPREVSKILHTDYSLLKLAASGYASLLASGRACRETELAELARANLRELLALAREVLTLRKATVLNAPEGQPAEPAAGTTQARAVVIDLPVTPPPPVYAPDARLSSSA